MTAAVDRDFAGEMRAVIDTATARGPYTPPLAASEIVEKLRANDPDLLDGWLHAQAEHFVWQAINDRDRSRRSVLGRRAKSSVFRSAGEAHGAGDSSGLRPFLDAPYTIGDGTRRPLAVLRRDDLLFVAADYGRRESENSLKKAFMAALAKKVGTGCVDDKFTEAQVSAMFSTLRT